MGENTKITHISMGRIKGKFNLSSEHRKKLFDYFTKVHLIMKTYKREEHINKVLNSNEMQFYLAC
jgi:hypothetical protein